MPNTRPNTKPRDRVGTERLLIEAVGDVLSQDGFTHVGASAVARMAGVDKALIYRYFNGFPQLLQAYGQQAHLWWSVEDILGSPLPLGTENSLANWLGIVFERHVAFLNHHPVTLEIIAWEMAERNDLTIALEYVREQRSLELMKRLLAQFGATDRLDLVHYGPAMTLLAAAGNYLAARARHVPNFNGLDLKSDRCWEQLFQAIETMMRGLVDARVASKSMTLQNG
jgi:AcrR family transcriptional regulator